MTSITERLHPTIRSIAEQQAQRGRSNPQVAKLLGLTVAPLRQGQLQPTERLLHRARLRFPEAPTLETTTGEPRLPAISDAVGRGEAARVRPAGPRHLPRKSPKWSETTLFTPSWSPNRPETAPEAPRGHVPPGDEQPGTPSTLRRGG